MFDETAGTQQPRDLPRCQCSVSVETRRADQFSGRLPARGKTQQPEQLLGRNLRIAFGQPHDDLPGDDTVAIPFSCGKISVLVIVDCLFICDLSFIVQGRSCFFGAAHCGFSVRPSGRAGAGGRCNRSCQAPAA
jgi:hypothetical protein